MAGQPEKIRLHRERVRVLALSRLFAPDPEAPGRISDAAMALPLPEGLSSRSAAARELMGFLDSEFADVRRLAASALGKMVPERPAASMFLPKLAGLAAKDSHPQVRQYALKAMARYPGDSILFLDGLKDVARDETSPAYVRSAAAATVAAVQEENRKRVFVSDRFCTRCHRPISEIEFRRAMDRFGRPYCLHCKDEKELEHHDFESTVEEAKRRRTQGGVAVQSIGEKRIAEFLEREHISFLYDERFRVSGADLIRPDFYLPEFDLYIEYYGMNTPQYNANRRRKHILYQRAGKRLISVSYLDDHDLVGILKSKLSRYIRFGEKTRADGPSSLASLVPDGLGSSPLPEPRGSSPLLEPRGNSPLPKPRGSSPFLEPRGNSPLLGGLGSFPDGPGMSAANEGPDDQERK